MGIRNSIARLLGYAPIAQSDPYALIPRYGPAKMQPLESVPAHLRAEAISEQYNIPDRQLPESQLELYQRLTWVQIAVGKVAEVAATTPFSVKRIAGENTEDVPNHPFELLLRRPNPLQSRAEFIEATVAHYALTGNAYWWLNKVGNTPAEIWVLPPHKVRPVPDGNLYLRGYIYEPDTNNAGGVPLELADVVHFKRFHPLNPFVGLSPIEALATVATGDLAAQKWNTNFFSRDNAKIPGILAFRDPIPDADWERMKDGIRNQYGGTNRALMMLRAVGNGVEWLPTAMSQADMQFLDGRTFTKEEIFALYAPGLSSMLAVNATEANSVSGKRTFIEYGVWPHLVRVGEKITNDVLPMYGSDIVGEFDDIRVTDKQMELAEIDAYSRTHTVDEVREKYYQTGPLGDDRGRLLVTEVGRGITNADPDAQEKALAMQAAMLEARTAQPERQEDPEDEGTTDNREDSSNAGEADDAPDEARRAEAKALRRWLRKRGDKADPAKFAREWLTPRDVVEVTLETADLANRATWDACKAMLLAHNPDDDDDPNTQILKALEASAEREIAAALRDTFRALLPPNAEDMDLYALQAYLDDRITTQALNDTIDAAVRRAADVGVNMAADQLTQLGVGFDYTLINTAAREWARTYSAELIRGITDTTQRSVRESVARWYTNGEPLSALTKDLANTFDVRRARLIAMTETTNAAAQGALRGYEASNVVKAMVWLTANDERVCPYCGSLDGAIVGLEGSFSDALPPELRAKLKGRAFKVPPAHPGCRCRIGAQVYEVGEGRRND